MLLFQDPEENMFDRIILCIATSSRFRSIIYRSVFFISSLPGPKLLCIKRVILPFLN